MAAVSVLWAIRGRGRPRRVDERQAAGRLVVGQLDVREVNEAGDQRRVGAGRGRGAAAENDRHVVFAGRGAGVAVSFGEHLVALGDVVGPARVGRVQPVHDAHPGDLVGARGGRDAVPATHGEEGKGDQ